MMKKENFCYYLGNLEKIILISLAIFLFIVLSCHKNVVTDQAEMEEDMTVEDYDGNVYKTVRIGTQIWMAENLKSTHYSDGTPVPNFVYNNNLELINVYGRLYKWTAVVRGNKGNNSNPGTIQGVAPEGWHIPSKAEWEELANSLGGMQVSGGKIKETGTVHWNEPNVVVGSKNLFNALPGGMYDFTGVFQWMGGGGCYSTSTKDSQQEVMCVILESGSAAMEIGGLHPNDAVSVRCIKNKD